MYAYIKGLLIEATPLHAVVEAYGIGYKISTPLSLFSNLTTEMTGAQILLHTSFVVRENAHTLYGFLTSGERDLFEALQSVTGVGPKMALGIVGHTTMKNLYLALSQNDIGAISKIPGIGKKTAERLILEMRDKLSAFFPQADFADYATPLTCDPKTQQINDAMSALINLGYNQLNAQKAIKKTLKEKGDEIDLGGLITAALQNI